MLLFFMLFLLQAHCTIANTEKVIFLGPEHLQVPLEHPTLEDLQLEALSPQHWTLRMHVEAEFPSESSKYGHSSWYLLHRLQEGQRYEVRICWAATQPTSFRLETYDLPTVFETPELITSLAEYSESRRAGAVDPPFPEPSISKPGKMVRYKSDDFSATLFLQVFAAADYYTTNKTLMENIPPVYVDIILDPYLFNIFPRSLVPTGAYITLLAIGSWYLAKYINQWVQNLAIHDVSKKNT